METRTCKSCNGTGLRYNGDSLTWHQNYYAEKGRTFTNPPCLTCDGAKEIAGPDVNAIIEAIKGRKGLRTKPPAYTGADYTLQNRRAYYVWRLARFHGGVDVTMPIVATTLAHGDPWMDELDRIADAAARAAYGTDLAAAYRWGNLLRSPIEVPAGMPVTAYSNGPVVTEEKPEEEYPELF